MCEAKVRVSGSVNHFPNFVRRLVRGPPKILKNDVWVRVRNTNNSTVLDFLKKVFLLFWFFGPENHAKSHILAPKGVFEIFEIVF